MVIADVDASRASVDAVVCGCGCSESISAYTGGGVSAATVSLRDVPSPTPVGEANVMFGRSPVTSPS